MKNRDYQTVAFDCDSTLSAIEGIDELARMKGIYDQISVLTKKAMQGKMDFALVFKQRLALVRPSKQDLKRLGELYIENIVPDAREVIACLLSLGKNVYIISGGYMDAVLALGSELGIPCQQVIAVGLSFDKEGNYLTYETASPLTRSHGKAEVLQGLPGKTCFVGDGITDLEAKPDIFLGFGGICSREQVKQRADYYIKDMSLAPVLPLIGISKARAPDYAATIDKGEDYLEKGGNHHA